MQVMLFMCDASLHATDCAKCGGWSLSMFCRYASANPSIIKKGNMGTKNKNVQEKQK